MEKMINKTRLSLIQGDITSQETDAIVNAASSSLMGGGGVDGAIHRAGGPAILEDCKKIVAQRGHLPAGQAVITTGGNLEARYVIHTVGPVWHGGKKGEPETLARAYRESLKIAVENSLKSLSFPSILDQYRRLWLPTRARGEDSSGNGDRLPQRGHQP